LRVAGHIQKGLLPSKIPQFNLMRIDAVYKPVADVGGDIYDFIRMGENRLGVFIGDASGHGLASSLIGTLSKMSLYNHSRADLPTSELLVRMNRDLKAHIHTSHYLTCFWCIFDFEKNILTYSRAGHPTPLVLRKDGTLHGLSGCGIFLGITDDAAFEENYFRFEAGDRFYWFTDGIYDVFHKERNDGKGMGGFLGYNLFLDLVKQTAGEPLDNVIAALKGRLSEFKFVDDYTLIVAEV
jgi:sigma-B regulation protein RsbU (phosphoserine phosphatase)